MVIVNFIFLMISIIFLIPILVFFIESSFACLPDKPKQESYTEKQPTFTILVPAHNEVPEIAHTLNELMSQIDRKDSILVIADNCTDNTAEVARNMGVRVLERYDMQHRGKGYALAYGLQFLEAHPPEVVVFVDADCSIAPNTIDTIVNRAYGHGRPIQATYLMEAAIDPTPKDYISTLAVIVKNLVRPLGLTRLHLPCLLNGSGMAFPWSVIRQISLKGSKNADDMQLTVDLALLGHLPLYCPEGRVIGRLMQEEDAISQRYRWEHGHIDMVLTEVPRLLQAAIVQKRLDLLALALELSVPPLSLLMMIWLVVFGCALLLTGIGVSWLTVGILAFEGILILSAIVAAWLKFGRSEIPGRVLLTFPIYMLSKIPIYLNFWKNPQTQWLKTERDSR